MRNVRTESSDREDVQQVAEQGSLLALTELAASLENPSQEHEAHQVKETEFHPGPEAWIEESLPWY